VSDYDPLLEEDLDLWEREFSVFEGGLGYSQRHFVGRLIATVRLGFAIERYRGRMRCKNCGAWDRDSGPGPLGGEWRECQKLWRYFPPYFGCPYFEERDEKNLASRRGSGSVAS